ncbi:MAG: hypothetical protein HY526_00390 [Betaproteobacteria bacterium]|nr:hypothetical protein [Betaproteobacteria bacterium]
MTFHIRFDVDLTPADIQTLANPDAVAAFFVRLGYDTNARTVQTPGNLGITAEGTLRPIRRIELIADQEELFQVYRAMPRLLPWPAETEVLSRQLEDDGV